MISAFLIVASLFSGPAHAAIDPNVIQEVKDVETLNDDLQRYAGMRIKVGGEVDKNINERSLVMESGGLFNDEIVVVAGPGVKEDFSTLTKSSNIMVTGTLILKTVSEISKENTWSLTPQLSTQVRDVKAFLVADEIIRQ